MMLIPKVPLKVTTYLHFLCLYLLNHIQSIFDSHTIRSLKNERLLKQNLIKS